jgi:hypothetical protein
MRRRHLLLLTFMTGLVVIAATATGSSSYFGALGRADVTIRHATFGCHLLSLNGGTPALGQDIVIRAGHSFTIQNRDNCRHTLIQTSGSKAMLMQNPVTGAKSDGSLAKYGSSVRVNLFKPGTYEFTTVEGAHNGEALWPVASFYRQETRGADNQLALNVTVLPPLDKFGH